MNSYFFFVKWCIHIEVTWCHDSCLHTRTFTDVRKIRNRNIIEHIVHLKFNVLSYGVIRSTTTTTTTTSSIAITYLFNLFVALTQYFLHVYFIKIRIFEMDLSKIYRESNRVLFMPKAKQCRYFFWKWNLFFIMIIALAIAIATDDAVAAALWCSVNFIILFSLFHFMYFNYFKSAIFKRVRVRMRMRARVRAVSINYAIKCTSHLFVIRNNLTRYLFIWMWRNRMTTTMTMTMMVVQ